MTKLRNSKCNTTQNINVPKLRKQKKTICDKACQLTFFKIIKSKFYETQNQKNDKTQNVTTLKNSSCDKTQKLKLEQNLTTKIFIEINIWQDGFVVILT